MCSKAHSDISQYGLSTVTAYSPLAAQSLSLSSSRISDPVKSTKSEYSNPGQQSSDKRCCELIEGLSGCWGGSGDLPQADNCAGVQAPCCLSPTLVVCPGDKPRSEFTTRPPQHSDKGTHAQRGQETRQDKPSPGPTRKPSTPLRKAQTARPEENLPCQNQPPPNSNKPSHTALQNTPSPDQAVIHQSKLIPALVTMSCQ